MARTEAPYQPTAEDILRIKPVFDKLKVSGDGVFATLQGEGLTAGFPSVFLRLHYCNLSCGVPDGWLCDTGYTWDIRRPEFWREPEDWSYEQTASVIKKAWENKFEDDKNQRLVITGGEPLLQQGKIAKLLNELPEWKIEIETNGTIMPTPAIQHCQFNCSPKLENSGNSFQRRYKPEVLKAINRFPDSQFKFVAMNPSDLDEIDRIVKNCLLDYKKILIMPEGSTTEEVEAHAKTIKEAVSVRSWKIIQRNQLIWYGPKRRT
jgi:7-carboxy-7-deazaguanine synthase